MLFASVAPLKSSRSESRSRKSSPAELQRLAPIGIIKALGQIADVRSAPSAGSTVKG